MCPQSLLSARVEQEILQLRRRLNVLEELLVNTRLTAERDLHVQAVQHTAVQQAHFHLHCAG